MRTAVSSEMSVLGVQFTVGTVSYRGTRESAIVMPGPLFGCSVGGAHTELVEVALEGCGRTKVRNSGSEQGLSLPADRLMTVKAKGEADAGYFLAHASFESFERVFGSARFGRDISPHYGAYGQHSMDLGIVRRIASLCADGETAFSAYSEALVTAFLAEWYGGFGGSALPKLVSSLGKRSFKQIVNYIDDSLEQDISITELAAFSGLSVSQFAHAFKREFGMAPYRYITQRRMLRAQSLLRTSTATIAEIATRVGFSSHSRFGQAFLRLVGSTPSAYRGK
jgi:AraC-like DNA-binding protein